jgi:hypothetical protein
MAKRGRQSNWDGIVERVGRTLYGRMREIAQATALCTPSRAALVRLGKAAMHACADADRQDKKKIREVQK